MSCRFDKLQREFNSSRDAHQIYVRLEMPGSGKWQNAGTNPELKRPGLAVAQKVFFKFLFFCRCTEKLFFWWNRYSRMKSQRATVCLAGQVNPHPHPCPAGPHVRRCVWQAARSPSPSPSHPPPFTTTTITHTSREYIVEGCYQARRSVRTNLPNFRLIGLRLRFVVAQAVTSHRT